MLHALNDKENHMDFQTLVFFSRRSKNWFKLHASQIALKQKSCHNPPNMHPIISYFQGRVKFEKHHFLATFQSN